MPAARSAADTGPDLMNCGRLPTTDRTLIARRGPLAAPAAPRPPRPAGVPRCPTPASRRGYRPRGPTRRTAVLDRPAGAVSGAVEDSSPRSRDGEPLEPARGPEWSRARYRAERLRRSSAALCLGLDRSNPRSPPDLSNGP